MGDTMQRQRVIRSAGGGDAVYGLGLIGALAYYISQASGFAEGVIGMLKAFVWPAFMVYDLFRFISG
ncbi:hypothetical protein [Paractinoplanes hotanensis]|uniref:Uncharacterized protein n=1 Tax=Paractinoplanes hotanensis TaxID=2906497 RepID=A0ABT0YE99_9ACTN|nr:hypothetical protein [Actinoplanes hotanensis]MCM4084376.1 hypothetical protein [Actinoplanes hotanensis]